MDECARLRPALKNESAFVNSYLTKLQPSPDVDWQNDPREHQRYLDRLWDFVGQLAPAHNSLKAHVLYHRLVFDRSQGEYSKQRFMEYLKFPRRVVYINPRFMELAEDARYPADLGHDPSSLTLMPPVRDDEPVVRSYLAHFFLEETTYQAYEPYVESDYLKHLFAETKIVNGLGEAEQWYSMLPPEKFQQLKDRIDLDFAHTSATVFAADGPVSVDLYVKNVQTLIVQVFEINARNFYEQNLREVNTDINLDGLIANDEVTHQYDAPPLRRTLRHFDFPGLREPGVYVIDFIGNGKSSRVVVRKGRLHYLVRTSAAGQIFTVLDDRLTKADDATLWMGGRLYTPADDGTIAVPFSTNPGRQPIILSRGNVSSLHFFQHQAEQYQLDAGIFVDRESLIMHETAQAVIRPGLKLNGIPISLSVLEEVQLTVTSTDHDGIETKKAVADFGLRENGEATFEFQVPPHLSKLDFLLSAKIQSFSQNKKVDVSASQSFAINEIDRTDKIEDLHLLRVDDGYFVELLGKSGESKPDRPVRLELRHRDFRETVHVTLKTDEAGRVELGPLPDIEQLTATGPQDTSHSWRLWSDRCSPRDIVHGQAGESLRIPYMGDKQSPSRDQISLLEVRGNTFVEDRFDALAINDGFLEISGLPAGDYDLWLKHEQVHTRIRLTAGKREYGYALGAKRRLELRGETPLQLARLEFDDAQVRVHLRNHSKFSRVHVLATRFYPAFDPFNFLSRIGDASPLAMSVSTQRSLYMAGRDIGDEYRYIIDRGYAKKYAGNMLERPSLLLNPWPIRSTETDKQVAAEGEDFAPAADETAAGAKREAMQRQLAEAPSDFANLDFLAEPSVVLINLMPDENGVVTVNRDDLGPHQQVHLVAVDPVSTVYRSVALPEIPRNPRDLRLADGLDPEKHYTQQKQVTILGSGGKFELSDIATSKFDTYDSLSRIHALYLTLTGDANLREFGFLLNWPKLSSDQKQEKYSKYACHELNFFLFKKDPEFFDSVVQPNLSHKLHKTFLDHWLLKYDLADYLKPWNYAQLNIVERLLLAQRIDGEGPLATRHVGDLFELKPRDIQYLNRLFDTAVRGTALESDDGLGLRKAIALEEKSRGRGAQLRLGESRNLAAEVDFAAPESAPATRAARPAAGRMMDRAGTPTNERGTRSRRCTRCRPFLLSRSGTP